MSIHEKDTLNYEAIEDTIKSFVKSTDNYTYSGDTIEDIHTSLQISTSDIFDSYTKKNKPTITKANFKEVFKNAEEKATLNRIEDNLEDFCERMSEKASLEFIRKRRYTKCLKDTHKKKAYIAKRMLGRKALTEEEANYLKAEASFKKITSEQLAKKIVNNHKKYDDSFKPYLNVIDVFRIRCKSHIEAGNLNFVQIFRNTFEALGTKAKLTDMDKIFKIPKQP